MPQYCDDCQDVRHLRACASALVAAGAGSEETAKPARDAEPPPNRTRTRKTPTRSKSTRACCAIFESRRGRRIPPRRGTGHAAGELAVDQRAYAEVGTPVAARVTRLLVNAGDTRAQRPDAGRTDEPGARARARASTSPPSARLTLAEAALERKRGLAAEKIVPLREVQEAESAAGKRARHSARPAPRSPPSASSRRQTMATARRRRRSCCAPPSRARSSSGPRSSVRCSIRRRRRSASATSRRSG